MDTRILVIIYQGPAHLASCRVRFWSPSLPFLPLQLVLPELERYFPHLNPTGPRWLHPPSLRPPVPVLWKCLTSPLQRGCYVDDHHSPNNTGHDDLQLTSTPRADLVCRPTAIPDPCRSLHGAPRRRPGRYRPPWPRARTRMTGRKLPSTSQGESSPPPQRPSPGNVLALSPSRDVSVHLAYLASTLNAR